MTIYRIFSGTKHTESSSLAAAVVYLVRVCRWEGSQAKDAALAAAVDHWVKTEVSFSRARPARNCFSIACFLGRSTAALCFTLLLCIDVSPIEQLNTPRSW